MKIKEFGRIHKKKIVCIAVTLIVVLVIVGVAVFFFLKKNVGTGSPFGQGGFTRGDFAVGENMVGASGITSVGITQENFEVEGLTEGLLVEQVYVSSGQELKQGDRILKLSDESVIAAREELEEILKSTELAYRAGVIEYEQNKITIAYDRDIAVLEGQQAQEIYDETIASLSGSVEKAQENLDDTKAQIAEYREIVAGDDYYETFKVGEYKALYDENLKLLTTKMEEWGATWSQVTSGAGAGSGMSGSQSTGQSSGMSGSQSTGQSGGMSGSQSTGQSSGMSGSQSAGQSDRMNTSGNMTSSVSGSDVGMNAATASNDAKINAATASNDAKINAATASNGEGINTVTASADQIYVLQSLYSVLEQNLADYEQAQADYEDAVANAALKLQTLELSLSSLENALSEAQTDYETRILQAKLTLEQSLAEAKRAESDYETAMEKAESDFEALKDAKEDAEQNLELFEKSVGDGYYYASQSGSILRVMVREEQYLISDGTIFTYTNPDEMTVTVSVDQSDISSISVGEEAYIQSTEYGSFRGVITQINPISQSESRTNVTYNVTVEFTGDVGSLQTNETVTVIFGIGGSTNEKTN